MGLQRSVLRDQIYDNSCVILSLITCALPDVHIVSARTLGDCVVEAGYQGIEKRPDANADVN